MNFYVVFVRSFWSVLHCEDSFRDTVQGALINMRRMGCWVLLSSVLTLYSMVCCQQLKDSGFIPVSDLSVSRVAFCNDTCLNTTITVLAIPLKLAIPVFWNNSCGYQMNAAAIDFEKNNYLNAGHYIPNV